MPTPYETLGYASAEAAPCLKPRHARRIGRLAMVLTTVAALLAYPSQSTQAAEGCGVNPFTLAETNRLASKLEHNLTSAADTTTSLTKYARAKAAMYNVELADSVDAPQYDAILQAASTHHILAELNQVTEPSFDFTTVSNEANDVDRVRRDALAILRNLQTIPKDLIRRADVTAVHIADPLPPGWEDYEGLARYTPNEGTEIYFKDGDHVFGHELGHAAYNKLAERCGPPGAVARLYNEINPADFAYTRTNQDALRWHRVTLQPYGSRYAGEDQADNSSALLTPYDTLYPESLCPDIKDSVILQRKLGATAHHFNQLLPGSGDYAIDVMAHFCVLRHQSF